MPASSDGWVVAGGIGERRYARIADGRIVEARLEWDTDGPRAGSVVAARLAKVLAPGRRGIARLADGIEALVEPVPPGLTEGARFHAELLREPIPEAGRPKRARVRVTDAPLAPAPIPAARTLPASGPDLLEAAGWSELEEEALTGEIAFPGGALRLSPTPAMALFDVDGLLPPVELALAGARAAAEAILRLDIGGAIGIDLPTLAGKAERARVADALDAILPQPFERTAVNGFGFVQIVRRRTRPSIPERLRADPTGAAARSLVRRAAFAPGHGTRTLAAAPAVLDAIRPDWLDALARRIGRDIALRPLDGHPISAAHVEVEHP